MVTWLTARSQQWCLIRCCETRSRPQQSIGCALAYALCSTSRCHRVCAARPKAISPDSSNPLHAVAPASDMVDADKMQFFSLQAESAAARAGTLITRRGAISTPTALIYTRRGGCMYLTPDMMDKLRPQAQGIQINAMQL